MRDKIYVGALISERELEHSSGPWKKHKYLKKIGDKYIYAKNKVGEVADKISDTAEKVADKAQDLAWDAQFEAEWQAGRAANAVKEGVKRATNPITGAEHRRAATYNQRQADVNESVANDLMERAKQTAGEQDKQTSLAYKKWADKERSDAAYYRSAAKYHRGRYNSTVGGKMENVIDAVGKKATRNKRLKEASKDAAFRSEIKRLDSHHNSVMSEMYRDDVINKRTNSRIPGEEASLASYHAKKSRSDARASTTLKRLSAARQSELERKSIKERSKRAKKRVEQALSRFKKKK